MAHQKPHNKIPRQPPRSNEQNTTPIPTTNRKQSIRRSHNQTQNNKEINIMSKRQLDKEETQKNQQAIGRIQEENEDYKTRAEILRFELDVNLPWKYKHAIKDAHKGWTELTQHINIEEKKIAELQKQIHEGVDKK